MSGPRDEEVCPSSPREALDEAWSRYSDEILKCCRAWMAGRATDSDEAFSRVWYRAVTNLPFVRPRIVNARAWLRRVAYHVCMDLYRERERRGEESLDVIAVGIRPAGGSDPERAMLRKELALFLRVALQQLPDTLRDAMIGYLDSSNYRELAADLAISEPNARKRVEQARKILRRRLDEYSEGRATRPSLPETELAPRPRDPGTRALRSIVAPSADGTLRQDHIALGGAPEPLPARGTAPLERYVESYPSGWKRRLRLARLYVRAGEVDRAIAEYEALTQFHPLRAEFRSELASLLRAAGRVDDLAALRDRASQARLPQAEIAYLSGVALLARGSHRDAEAALEDAHRLRPSAPAPLVALAELHLASGRMAAAIASADAALAVDPDDVAALTITAPAMRFAGRSNEARRRNARALHIDPDHAVALPRAVEQNVRAQKSGGEAPVGQLAATNAAAARALAFRDAAGGDVPGALERLARLHHAWPAMTEVVVERVRVLDLLGLDDDAAAAFAEAERLAPRRRDAQLLGVAVLTRAGRIADVLRVAQSLLEEGSWMSVAMAAWAMARCRSGELTRAFADFALAREEGLPAAWLQYGVTLTALGAHDAAADALAAGFALLPPDDGYELACGFAIALAEVQVRAGRAADARAWARRGVDAVWALSEHDLAYALAAHERLAAIVSDVGAAPLPSRIAPLIALDRRFIAHHAPIEERLGG